jgi:hypothetical protein
MKNSITLPDLTRHYQQFLDTNSLIPGWPKTPKVIRGSAAHVSAVNLKQSCPGTLAKAFNNNHPDKTIWMESYKEEYYGLVALNTFTVIDAKQYQEIRIQTGKQAIPSMGILTVKNDAEGRPLRAKSRIVVLSNHETTPWSRADCFAPVVSAPVV